MIIVVCPKCHNLLSERASWYLGVSRAELMGSMLCLGELFDIAILGKPIIKEGCDPLHLTCKNLQVCFSQIP